MYFKVSQIVEIFQNILVISNVIGGHKRLILSLRPSERIKILRYVLMDNFYPCSFVYFGDEIIYTHYQKYKFLF